MRFLIFFLLITTSLFSRCDSSSLSSVYQTYTDAKQNYINAILTNNKQNRIKALKTIIKCGNLLGFDVSEYQKEINRLKLTKNPLKLESKYIKIISYYPLKIKLSSKMKIKYFTLNDKYYSKIFDIYNAKITSFVYKKLSNDIYLKIAQNNSKRVRLVLFSKKDFKIKYSKKSNYLTINFFKKAPKYVKLKPIIELKENKIKQKKVNKKESPIIPIVVNFRHNKIVVIDPGHGGKDVGGVANGVKEKDVVLKIGLYLRDILKQRGYKVYMTRYGDKFITLKNRTKYANNHHADLFLSIHCNIFREDKRVKGITTYYLSPARTKRASEVAKYENSAIGNLGSMNQQIILNFLNRNRIIQSVKFAMDIQKNLIYNLKKHYSSIEDRGVRPAPFWVLVGTEMPSILLETGFLTNYLEAKRLNNSTYQKRYAKAIADGIDSYFLKNR